MRLLKLGLCVFAISLLAHCYGPNDKNISGVLQIYEKTGYNYLEFKDAKTDAPFRLYPGKYSLSFNQGLRGYAFVTVDITDETGRLMGSLSIPRKSIKSDGTFEIYMGDKASSNAFNILGGKRTIVLDRVRTGKLHESCTYIESYSCDVPCTDVDGNSTTCSSTCTRVVSGHQDQLWEKRTFKNLYRILFDAADLYNVGQFVGDGISEIENEMISSDTCK